MVFVNAISRIRGSLMPATGAFVLMFCFLLGTTNGLRAAEATPAPPNSLITGTIPPVTAFADQPFNYVVNGAFVGRDLTYSATLADGSALPDWLSLDAKTATFTALAPRSLSGKMYHIALKATDLDLNTATTTFYLTVDYHSPDCVVDANVDRLAKILQCNSGTVKLRGHASTGIYKWTGPNGFTSSERYPVVNTAGVYVLVTTTSAGRTCARRSVVRVRAPLADCGARSAKNKLPQASFISSATTGEQRLTAQLDANASFDQDGEIIRYSWAWTGGAAVGARPVVDFGVGTHDVVLTVTDNHGAKSTDRVTINVEPRPEYSTHWLEAECGIVGENWASVYGNKVSGGVYLRPLLTSTSTAPAAAPANRVRLVVKDVREGVYRLFARIDSKDTHSDSYWIRINDGSWFAWNSGILKDAGFNWNMLRRELDLKQGTNIIDLAYRERDTNIDKLYLTADGDTPTGLGGSAVNCRLNEAPLAKANADNSSGLAPHAAILDGSGSFDTDGTIVRYDWAWEGGTAAGLQPQVLFEAGAYEVTLTVTDEEGATATDRILITATTPPPPPPPTDSEENGGEVADDEPSDPTGNPMGDPGSDTGDEPTSIEGYWLEAECAEVGGEWTTRTASTASNGKYVVALHKDAYKTAPEDIAANQIRFSLYASEVATYHLFGRIDAPTSLDDSYWVRINGGEWFKWYHGIHKGKGFKWNKMQLPVKLKVGNNTIDFAYRENGARLDKIHLSKTDLLPETLGPAGTNCSQAVAYEAECAEVGSGWTTINSNKSSGGAYVVFGGARRTSEPTGPNAAEELHFNVTVSQAGEQHLFFHLNAPDAGSNSLWVRVDNGDWIKFWQEIGGKQLLTEGFEWRKLNDNGTDIAFNLDLGAHVITVANREAGTRLDKIQLSTKATLPTDFGEEATNCGGATPTPMAMRMPTGRQVNSASDRATEDVILYPNPAGQDINVELIGEYVGRVSVHITDASGRSLSRGNFEKTRSSFRKKLDVVNLPPGIYFVRLITDASESTQPFVKQ